MDKIKEKVQELYDQLANFTTNGFSRANRRFKNTNVGCNYSS